MKFITSSISMAMFMAKDYDLKVHELTEEEFQALAYDAISHIGQEDIAELTNFAYNKQPLQLRVGDVLLIAKVPWRIKIPLHTNNGIRITTVKNRRDVHR